MGTFGDTSVVNLIGYFTSAGSFLFQLIGFATPFWVDISGRIKIHSGLWQVCIRSSCESIRMCSDNTRPCQQFKATQAMESLSLILFLAGVVLIVLKLFVLKEKEVLRKCGGLSCVIAGILAIVGVVLYATIDTTRVKYLHFSFAFCVIAAGGGIVGGTLSFIK